MEGNVKWVDLQGLEVDEGGEEVEKPGRLVDHSAGVLDGELAERGSRPPPRRHRSSVVDGVFEVERHDLESGSGVRDDVVDEGRGARGGVDEPESRDGAAGRESWDG